MASLIAFRVLLGIGESIYLPGGSKIVSLLFRPHERGLPAGLFDAGTRTGLVMEGVLVPMMLVHLGWRQTFMVVGFSALVWLAPWFLLTPRNLREPHPHTGGAAGGFGRALVALVTNRNLVGVCLTFFCFDYYWYFLVNWLPDYLVTARGLTMMRAGIYAALPYLVFGMSEPIGGWLADRLVVRGWTQSRARKTVVTVAFMTGLLLIPGRVGADASCGRGVHHRRMPGRPRDGQPARRAPELRTPIGDRSLDRHLQLHRESRRHHFAAHHRLLIAQRAPTCPPSFSPRVSSRPGRSRSGSSRRSSSRRSDVPRVGHCARRDARGGRGAGTAARVRRVAREPRPPASVAAARGPTRHPARISGASVTAPRTGDAGDLQRAPIRHARTRPAC